MRLTPKHVAALYRFSFVTADGAEGSSIPTRRPNRVVRDLLDAGFIRDEGWCEIDDGDGYGLLRADGSVVSRRCFSITDAGRAAWKRAATKGG